MFIFIRFIRFTRLIITRHQVPSITKLFLASIVILPNIFCRTASATLDPALEMTNRLLQNSVHDSKQNQKQFYFNFYQDLHKNPEMSREEKRTGEKMSAAFKDLGLEVFDKIGGHGVIGILKNGSGPTTVIRSELDGLPVTEETHLPYASQTPGKMQACGHDFHSTILLAAAQTLVNNKDAWKGTLVFLAQPAEEIAKGAKAMIADGVLKKFPKPDQFIALHTVGVLKKGVIGVTPGYVLANSDAGEAVFKGKGTHGSTPESGIDPFTQMAEFILKLQTLLGREKDSRQPAVISVGAVNGGMKSNIIPEEVKVLFTVRTFDPDVREFLKRRISEIVQGISKLANAPPASLTFGEPTDATYNDPALAKRIRTRLAAIFGEEHVVEPKAVLAAEDFGQFGKTLGVPSLFITLGEADERDSKINNHSPRYAPDFDKTFAMGVAATVGEVLELHKK